MRPWTTPADHEAAGREIGCLLDLLFDGLTREDFTAAHPYRWSPYKHCWYVVRHPRGKPGSALTEFRAKILDRDRYFPWVVRRKPYRPGRPKKQRPPKSLKEITAVLDRDLPTDIYGDPL